MNNYLISLGLSKGVDEKISNKTIRDWMQYGSWMEDIAPDIATSHFYDPLTNKGYVVLGVEIGQSSYDRANDLPSHGPWVWARKRLYDGLTQINKTTREQYLGIAFQALGRVMHLVQDVAVPAHTRNDFHTSDSYEAYTNSTYRLLNYASIHFPYWHISISQGAPKQFWDFDSYKGTMPNYTGHIGLAEYTNANFFSEDTIFSYYPHPAKEKTTAHLVEQYASDGKLDETWYIMGYQTERLAAYSYFWDKSGLISEKKWLYHLDSFVYESYAEKLIPRAVGYSAGLLNYFFRGQMEAIDPEPIRDASSSITGAKLKVKNITEKEAIGPQADLVTGEIKGQGKFVISYNYKDASGNDTFGLSNEVELTEAIASGYASTQEFTFTFTETIPQDAQETKYWLVYRGRLGSEADAVVGKVIDIEQRKDYIFLVNTLERDVLALRINKTEYTYALEAVDNTEIKTAMNFFDRPSTLLTIQSHPEQTEHTVATPWYMIKTDGTVHYSTYDQRLDKYGKVIGDNPYYSKDIIVGFPNAYVPETFEEGSPYVWDKRLQYGEWVSKRYTYFYKWRLASYIHGRRPFKFSDNRLAARNISIRKNGDYTYSGDDYKGPFHIQYKDSTGQWVRGMDLPHEGGSSVSSSVSFRYQINEEYFSGTPTGYRKVLSPEVLSDGESSRQWPTYINYKALLDIDKTIHTSMDYNGNSSYSLGDEGQLQSSSTTTKTYVNNFCDRTFTDSYNRNRVFKNVDSLGNYSYTKRLLIGDSMLEEFSCNDQYKLNSYLYFGGEESLQRTDDSNPDCWLSGGTQKTESTSDASLSGDTVTLTIDDKAYTTFSRNYSYASDERDLIKVLDYDHTNGDENYIMVYEYEDYQFQESSKSLSNVAGIYGEDKEVNLEGPPVVGCCPPYDREVTSIYKTGYTLAYRVNGNTKKSDLDIHSTTTYSLHSGWSKIDTEQNGSLSIVDGTYEESTLKEGQRIRGVSTQINTTFMVYTYIVENYDVLYDSWAFDRRIIGIINIADPDLPDDKPLQFEITDENAAQLLSDHYKDDDGNVTYDYSDLAAIGVHREK
jgi:hypothetical protein